MKIENNYFILTKKLNDEAVYLTLDYELSNDIRDALKSEQKITALFVRDDYEDEMKEVYGNDYKSDLNVLPLKITYEY